MTPLRRLGAVLLLAHLVSTSIVGRAAVAQPIRRASPPTPPSRCPVLVGNPLLVRDTDTIIRSRLTECAQRALSEAGCAVRLELGSSVFGLTQTDGEPHFSLPGPLDVGLQPGLIYLNCSRALPPAIEVQPSGPNEARLQVSIQVIPGDYCSIFLEGVDREEGKVDVNVLGCNLSHGPNSDGVLSAIIAGTVASADGVIARLTCVGSADRDASFLTCTYPADRFRNSSELALRFSSRLGSHSRPVRPGNEWVVPPAPRLPGLAGFAVDLIPSVMLLATALALWLLALAEYYRPGSRAGVRSRSISDVVLWVSLAGLLLTACRMWLQSGVDSYSVASVASLMAIYGVLIWVFRDRCAAEVARNERYLGPVIHLVEAWKTSDSDDLREWLLKQAAATGDSDAPDTRHRALAKDLAQCLPAPAKEVASPSAGQQPPAPPAPPASARKVEADARSSDLLLDED